MEHNTDWQPQLGGDHHEPGHQQVATHFACSIQGGSITTWGSMPPWLDTNIDRCKKETYIRLIIIMMLATTMPLLSTRNKQTPPQRNYNTTTTQHTYTNTTLYVKPKCNMFARGCTAHSLEGCRHAWFKRAYCDTPYTNHNLPQLNNKITTYTHKLQFQSQSTQQQNLHSNQNSNPCETKKNVQSEPKGANAQ